LLELWPALRPEIRAAAIIQECAGEIGEWLNSIELSDLDKRGLLARAEAAYRFENETAATSGTITGLSGFSFEGQDTNQFWLRGGLGAEVDVAGGTASLNVNVTTQSDDPTVWIRSGWKVTF
jgi:hypothetical protein